MPNLIVPDEALENWVDSLITGFATLTDCYLRLCAADLIVDSETTLEELEAVEAGFEGYEPKQLLNWSATIIEANDATSEADPVTFQADEDSDELIYGCYATTADDPCLLFAMKFDAPVAVPFEAELRAIVVFNLRSIFPS